ncbi:MAG: OmpA family protein [Alphaproteobacteria bacterium]|nr:OmpA family protein [Alphaproteobacteria bacterium]
MHIAVEFAPLESTIGEAARAVLEEALAQHDLLPPEHARDEGSEEVPNWEWGLRLKGYADDTGSSVEDQALSTARVQAVTEALTGLGIDRARIRSRIAFGDVEKATARDGRDLALGGTGPSSPNTTAGWWSSCTTLSSPGARIPLLPGYYNHLRDTLSASPSSTTSGARPGVRSMICCSPPACRAWSVVVWARCSCRGRRCARCGRCSRRPRASATSATRPPTSRPSCCACCASWRRARCGVAPSSRTSRGGTTYEG